MKKLLFIAVLTSMISAASAQEVQMLSKRGVPILPEAGDWSIGINAIPFIDWAFDKTRIMSASPSSSASGAISSQMPMTLVGLYMRDAESAYRARVGINFMSHSQEYNVTINNDTITLGNHQVVDEVKVSGMGITLGAGIQKFRGKGRLKGIYGAEVVLMFGTPTKTTYTYGNAFITDTTKANLGSAFILTDTTTGAGGYMSSRNTETKTGSSFGFGIDGFVGVEYFVLPKMSVSAEYNWGIMISSRGEGTTASEETYNPVSTSSAVAVRTRTDKSARGKTSDFGIRNGDIATAGTGNVVFHFYF